MNAEQQRAHIKKLEAFNAQLEKDNKERKEELGLLAAIVATLVTRIERLELESRSGIVDDWT